MWLCGLTFELTPTAEAGAVRPGGDDSTAGADRPYSACRSGSGVERVVRPRPHRYRATPAARNALMEATSCLKYLLSERAATTTLSYMDLLRNQESSTVKGVTPKS